MPLALLTLPLGLTHGTHIPEQRDPAPGADDSPQNLMDFMSVPADTTDFSTITDGTELDMEMNFDWVRRDFDAFLYAPDDDLLTNC
ncbi:MAG: hypothetical protein CL912_04620 [Deltaproteobacteria bacterium]|nr:hypothetical protein [Deltaproteobacteria bacterium]